MSTDTLRDPAAVPEAGETLSQFPPELVDVVAVQSIAAPLIPGEATVTVWALGLSPPTVAAKFSVVGESCNDGHVFLLSRWVVRLKSGQVDQDGNASSFHH